MSTLEIRQEMLEIIKNEEESSLIKLYALIKSYKRQRQMDKMIAEGEEDIASGKLYSRLEIQKMIEGWVE